MEVNSWLAPRILISVTALPSRLLNKMRRKLLPIVFPNPRSNGSAHELSVVTGQGASVTYDLTWKLGTAPANVHGNISELSVCPVFLTLGRRP
jgi:hypothetical protein